MSKNSKSKSKSPEPAADVRTEDNGATWEHPLALLRKQQGLVRTPNANDPGYRRQKENGKLWVRERVSALLDAGSFFEIGSISGKPILDEKTHELRDFIPANMIIGWGKVDGRKVFVTADDFSVRGGHADGGIMGKGAHGEALARKARVPLIRLLDGSSGGGSVVPYLTAGAMYIPPLAGLGQSMDALATVPVVSALLGPVVGLGAAKAVTSHFSVMVKGLSQLFAAGPPIVKQATYEDLSKEALGGWEIHGKNGTIDNLATSELDAFQQIRAFLSYLPSSIHSLPPLLSCTDSPDRREEELIRIIPRRRGRPYDIRKLIQLIVDLSPTPSDERTSQPYTGSSFFEIGETWGTSVITGLARMQGRTIGVLSSDCTVNGGALDAFGGQKLARFINLCDHFSIPLVNLVDQPGFAVGSAAEKMATIRHGASAMSALYTATVPIFTIIIRRSFGVGGGVLSDPEDGVNTRVAWPSGDWGSLPLEGGIEAAYKRQLDQAPSPAAREKIMGELLAKFEDIRSPLNTAHRFGVEEIIDPRDTRPLVCEWVVHMYNSILQPRLATKEIYIGRGRGYRL